MNAFKLLSKGTKFDSKHHSKRFKPNNEPADANEQSINENRSSITSSKNCIVIGENEQNLPRPIESFEELNLPEYLAENLRKSNYLTPTQIQSQTIPLMLDGQQLIGCAPTGSGKTLAFLLPLLINLRESKSEGFRAIILAPTRELVKQIHRESLWIASGSGLRIHMIKNVNLAAKKFNSTSKIKYDLLITTPKRLEYLLKQNHCTIRIDNLEWLIVDEYDRLLQSTFIEQLSSIFNICFERSTRILKLAMFSATFNHYLYEWCRSTLNDIITIIVGDKNQVVDSIEQRLVFVGNEHGKLFALKEMLTKGCQVPILIFVNTVRKANYLQHELQDMISVDTIHSERKQEIRDQIVRSFRQGKIVALICTELMGRGIDFKAVNLVVNYDLPSSPIAYIHNVGRTGRAGRHGEAITFFTLKDEKKRIMRSIVQVMRQSPSAHIPDHLIK